MVASVSTRISALAVVSPETDLWSPGHASLQMNIYKVIFRGRDDELMRAQRYRREGDQYVFETEGDTAVQFFDASEVVGVVLLPPDAFQSQGGGAH